MKQSSRCSRSAAQSLLLAGLLLLPSCKTNGEQWSFAVSRSVYGGSGSDFSFDPACGGGGEAAAAGLLALLLLPVALDLVFLPVALTHDLCD